MEGHDIWSRSSSYVFHDYEEDVLRTTLSNLSNAILYMSIFFLHIYVIN